MTELTAKARKKLSKKKFGLPGRRAFPMPDASHAKNAKARASQGLKAGTLSQSAYDKIVAMANKVLGKK
jgi:hypothetical protein